MHSVRVLVKDNSQAGNHWSYTNHAVMENINRLKDDPEYMKRYFCYSKYSIAEQVFNTIIAQSSHRDEFLAVALVEVGVYSEHISERSVLSYREF